jgi:hypothetical protein
MTHKCVHGVYLASTEEVKSMVARYCSFCTPTVDDDIKRRQKVGATKELLTQKVRRRSAKRRIVRRLELPISHLERITSSLCETATVRLLSMGCIPAQKIVSTYPSNPHCSA